MKATGANSGTIDALAADDKPRKDFMKACLRKLGLSVNKMEAFRECWKRQGNDKRTESKDA